MAFPCRIRKNFLSSALHFRNQEVACGFWAARHFLNSKFYFIEAFNFRAVSLPHYKILIAVFEYNGHVQTQFIFLPHFLLN
jgi:hypothetical protein